MSKETELLPCPKCSKEVAIERHVEQLFATGCPSVVYHIGCPKHLHLRKVEPIVLYSNESDEAMKRRMTFIWNFKVLKFQRDKKSQSKKGATSNECQITHSE